MGDVVEVYNVLSRSWCASLLSLLLAVSLGACGGSDGPSQQNDGDVDTGADADDDADVDEGADVDEHTDTDDETDVDEDTDADDDGHDDDVDCAPNDSAVHTELIGYVDTDGDTYTVGAAVTLCTNGALPEGYAAIASLDEDCDDDDDTAWESLVGYVDNDGDHATVGEGVDFCTAGELAEGYDDTASTDPDCDDDDAYAHPGAASLDSATACTRDFDADGYGDPVPTNVEVVAGTDCDDADDSIFVALDGALDDDGDGYTLARTTLCTDGGLPSKYLASATTLDCDDADARTFPGAASWDGQGCMRDSDDDDRGDADPTNPNVTAGTDCDDTNRLIYITVTRYYDGDRDGYGTTAETLCGDGSPSVDFADAGGDCDNGNPLVHPGFPELPDDGVDNDCSGSALTREEVNGIYVSSTSCELTPPPFGSTDNPYCKLSDAIAARGSGTYFVTGNSGAGSIVIDGSVSVSLHGGYDRSTWTRPTNYGHGSTISATLGATETLTVSNGAVALIDGFSISGPQNASAHLKARSVYINNGSFVRIVNTGVGPGVPGTAPEDQLYGAGIFVENNVANAPTLKLYNTQIPDSSQGHYLAAGIVASTEARLVNGADEPEGLGSYVYLYDSNARVSRLNGPGAAYVIFGSHTELTLERTDLHFLNDPTTQATTSAGVWIDDGNTDGVSSLAIKDGTLHSGTATESMVVVHFDGSRIRLDGNDLQVLAAQSARLLDIERTGHFGEPSWIRRNTFSAGMGSLATDYVAVSVKDASLIFANNTLGGGGGYDAWTGVEVSDGSHVSALFNVIRGGAGFGTSWDPELQRAHGFVVSGAGSSLVAVNNVIYGGYAQYNAGGKTYGIYAGTTGTRILASHNLVIADVHFRELIGEANNEYTDHTSFNTCVSVVGSACAPGTGGNLRAASYADLQLEFPSMYPPAGSVLIDAGIAPEDVGTLPSTPSYLIDDATRDLGYGARPFDGDGVGGAAYDIGAYEWGP